MAKPTPTDIALKLASVAQRRGHSVASQRDDRVVIAAGVDRVTLLVLETGISIETEGLGLDMPRGLSYTGVIQALEGFMVENRV